MEIAISPSSRHSSVPEPSNIESAASAPQPMFDPTVQLKDIIKTLPPEVFVKDRFKAWSHVVLNGILVSLGWLGISVLPWYTLPLSWLFTGTCFFGLFVIAHDCGHRSFAQRKWVNNLVGHIALMPCIYPFHAWRIHHNQHHKYTNHLDLDNTWNPYRVEGFNQFNQFEKWVYRALRGPFWWVGSIFHWGLFHFRWDNLEGQQREQVRYSVVSVMLVMLTGFPLLIATAGWWGWFSLWFMPWLVFHFWLSTVTLTHHTQPQLHFEPQETWHEAKAQLVGTVDCKYPRWFEWICHDINVHVPHHLTTAIPWYNLRRANASLHEQWGSYMTCSELSWTLIKQIIETCHLYSPERGYQSFQEANQESPCS